MIDRLIPRYPTFLIVGFVIMLVSLLLLMTGRDAMIVVWANKFFDGETDATFKAAQTADQVIDHTLKALLFVGLSFIKLGIGFAITTIVRNLRATGRATLDSYSSAGITEADEYRFTEPWFGRVFPRLLLGGMAVVLFFFLLTLWWDANLVFLKRAQFDGETSGTAYHTYLVVERVLDALIGTGKFVGEAMLILGIATGLATIITNLSLQVRVLPALTRRALGGASGASDPIRPIVPWGLIAIAIAGASILIAAFPLGVVRASYIGWALGRQFDAQISPVAIRMDALLSRAIDPVSNLGLGLLFFAIAYLLLTIIAWLRQQRKGFGDAVADLSAGDVSRPVVEETLWPQRLVAPLAIFGISIILFFFFSMTALRMFNYDSVITMQLAGVTNTVDFQNATRLDAILKPVIGATRFIGVASIMLAISLALVTIVVHLRATAMLLPLGFSRLIPLASGETPDDADEELELTLDEPMSLAPWNLLWPHLAGLAIMVSTTVPIIVLYAVSIHRNMEESFLGRGDVEGGIVSGLYKSSFLSTHLFEASWPVWMLFGMALVLFAIGRFFTTIVAFVQARRMIIGEATSTISEALIAKAERERERVPA